MADGGSDLRELLDRVANLLVKDTAVGYHDDRVKHDCVAVAETDQLMSKPGDGVGLSAASRMLDEIPLAGSILLGISQKSAHYVQLVVAGPDLRLALLTGLAALGFYDLGIVSRISVSP